MAPIRFPINDWDGDGTTDSLFDIAMEMKVYESFQKEETDFLDELIPELPLNLSTADYDNETDNDYENTDSQNTVEETVFKTEDVYKIIWSVLRSVFKEYVGIEFDEKPEIKTVEEILNYYKGGWREKCESGKEYFLSPHQYKTEAEYIAVLEYAKRAKERYEKKIENVTKNYYIDEKCEDNTIYKYCGVVFDDNTLVFHYIANDENIRPGDAVIVPVGINNEEKEATVVSVGEYLSNAVPYPIAKTKEVIRKK
mgnify:CR=1 FL=1